jgi:hypothetical protein
MSHPGKKIEAFWPLGVAELPPWPIGVIRPPL